MKNNSITVLAEITDADSTEYGKTVEVQIDLIDLDTEELLLYLETKGFQFNEEDFVGEGLDYADQTKLDEIRTLFNKGSWQEREEIYKRITNGESI